VKDSFARAVALKKRTALAREVVRLQEELLGFTKIKFQAGDVSGLDVNLAEVELSKAKKELLSTQRDSREALLALQEVLGMKPDFALSIEGDLPVEVPVPADKEQLRRLMFAQRPDMKASYLEVERTASAVALVKKEAVPNVTVAGFYNRDEEKNEVGVELSVPLPFFDRKQAEKAEAIAKRNQAEIKTDGLKKTAEKEFEQAYGDLLSAIDELNLFKREIMSKAAENLELLNLAYKEGKIGFFEVRLAQKETIETQFDYLDTQLRAEISVNALEKTLGGQLK
jgi:cobalt-zinc-cadmium efflux system outer membrane protein